MGEKQDELEMLRGEYTIETSQLKELDEKLGVNTYNKYSGVGILFFVWGDQALNEALNER